MPKSFQIPLSGAERSKLIDRIENDFRSDKASHRRWADRCAGWLQKWEARMDAPQQGEEDAPNHVVPLIQWQCFNKLARDIQSLLGENAEITARATGPSDHGKVRKVGCWMTSRVFDQMQIINPLCEFEFRRILNGWSAAYRPWWRREFDTLNERGRILRVCDYEGPGFFPLEPDDLMIPAERGVKSLHGFSHIVRRVPVTVDDIQRGAGALYFEDCGKSEFVKKLIDWAQQNVTNDYTLVGEDPVREERERSEGVDYDAFMLGRRTIWMWEWYGYWRPLKKQQRDAEIDDLEKRLPYEADYVVKYIPGMNQIVGCQDLLQLYPKMRRRRPFVESTLIKDGTYRPKGFGALLEDLEDDATANSRLFQAAGELSVWPIVFYKPGGGMNPGAQRLKPGFAYPTEDPSSVNVLNLRPNLEFAVARQQDIFTTAERLTSQSDQSLGLSIQRPNAPRTATGQLALIEEGNIRAYLDSTILREDMEQIIGDFWDLDCDLVPRTDPGLFFRVTEQQAGGLFDVRQGGAFMTPKEFGGRYDFRLKFATSVWSRQAKKAEFVAFYDRAMANPLIASNPRALWVLMNRLAKEFDIEDFADIVPEPPAPDTPKTPDVEWNEMLEGTPVEVNPLDHDDLHIQQHIRQAEDERKSPTRDAQAIGFLVKHILDHQRQKREKMLMASLTQDLIRSIQPAQNDQSPMEQQLAELYGGRLPGAGAPPTAPEEPAAAPPQPGVGSTAAPQPHEGML
jgi:hypothetical protein